MAHGTDRTDRQVAAYNLRLACARLARATRLLPSEPMEFPGTVTADWSKYCKIRSRADGDRRVVSNLTALLASTPDRYSCRNIAFNDWGSLEIYGDWVADLDGNGDELCLTCAARDLLTGDLGASRAPCSTPASSPVRCISPLGTSYCSSSSRPEPTSSSKVSSGCCRVRP